MSCDATFILDSSLIIELKRAVPADRQWELAKYMETLVEVGRITFPPQVLREIRGQKHTDIPEAWVLAVGAKITQSNDPAYEHIEAVMAVASDLIDADTEIDPADPYVIALAREKSEEGTDTYVVTADVVDRPPLKISMRTACERLGTPWMDIDEFLECMYEELGWAPR
jgi:rRNA maturation endonuclease Nob1